MKRLLVRVVVAALLLSNVPAALADSVYFSGASYNGYLPTVKVLSYSTSYDGELSAEAYGSGTLIDSKGTILTNNHVIENTIDPSKPNDAFQICLTSGNGLDEPDCSYTARLLARDPELDLALLKMDTSDVLGHKIDINFYLPYANQAEINLGDAVTVAGFPDTGGRSITLTKGNVSGFLNEGGVRYIKTDADISFGNSGGTAVDAKGNLIGVPTFIIDSYSSEVLGYLIPMETAAPWIKSHISAAAITDEASKQQLADAIVANINANKTGTYKNNYPPYQISLIDGWKFGNGLEASFESYGYGASHGSNNVVLYPLEDSEGSTVFVDVSVTNYAYEVGLDDVEYILGQYAEDGFIDQNSNDVTTERTTFNGYDAVKDQYSYYDWYSGMDIESLTYYIPYGNDVINVAYSYTLDEESRLSEIDRILDSFKVDMKAVVSSVVDSVENTELGVKVVNESDKLYLSDNSYEYDGVEYFAASFGAKRNYDFAIDIYSDQLLEDETFESFQESTMTEALDYYEIVSQGELRVDGEDGFFFTDQYDSSYGGDYFYTTIYLKGEGDTYFTVYFSGDSDSYDRYLSDLKMILENMELGSERGADLIPNFIGGKVAAGSGSLSDIENYLYEENVRTLADWGVFGDDLPNKFNPGESMKRGEFIVWAIKGFEASPYEDFKMYQESDAECEACFADVDYDSEEADFYEYAFQKGAIGGMKAGDKYMLDPDGQLTLVAALKIMSKLYDLPVWEAPDFVDWYIPYLHLGYRYYAIPYGVSDAGYVLSRGEAAYVLNILAW